MSNVLSPIVARYSLFFTLTMFSSSIVSQSRQPTRLVQTLLVEAQQRYQDSTTQKIRALIRNISTSTSSTSASKSSAVQTLSTSTELSSPLSCKTYSSDEALSTVLDLSSFPLVNNRVGSDADEHLEGGNTTTQMFTLLNEASIPPVLTASSTASRTNVDASSGLLNQHQTRNSSIEKKHASSSNDCIVASPVQGSKVSRTSIATLLSVTLTMILLSLLQNKKRCIRRRARSFQDGSRRHRRSRHRHRDGYKSYSLDRFTNSPYSQSSHTTTLTLMDNMTEIVSSPPPSHLHHHQSAGFVTKANHEPTPFMLLHNIDSDRQSSMPNFELGHYYSNAPNIYGGNNVAWSLSDGHLPGKRTKDDFIAAWVTQQSFNMDVVNPHETTRRTLSEISENIHGLDGWDHQLHQQHSNHNLYNNREAQKESRQERHISQQNNKSLQSSPSMSSKASSDHPSQHYHSGYHHQYQPTQPPPPNLQDYHHYPTPPHHHHRLNRNIPEHQQNRYNYHQEQLGYQHAHYRYEAPTSDGIDYIQHRSLSLTGSSTARGQHINRYSPPPPLKHEELSLAEQARQEHQLRRQRHQMHHQHLQQYRQQQQQQQLQLHHHYRREHQQHYAPSQNAHYYHAQAHFMNVPVMPAYDPGQYPSRHQSPKSRTANDLAWERHCYYQQQQHMEEALAERKRMEARRRQEHQGQQQGTLYPQEQDLAARTVSLNRDSSISLPSQAAQVLGLSRSKSASAVFGYGEGRKSSKAKKEKRDSIAPKIKDSSSKEPFSDCKVLSASLRLIRKNDSKNLKAVPCINVDSVDDIAKDLSLLQPVPVPPQAQAPLVRKNTLSSSIRSLARRCSSRFSNRPNSFAGISSDPIIQFPEKQVEATSFNLGTSYVAQPSESDQAKALDLQLGSRNTINATKRLPAAFQLFGTKPERVPIHRKVTLFRSKTMTHPRSSSPMLNTDQLETTPSNTAAADSSRNTWTESLTTNPQDPLLRLANGRGFDISAVSSRTQPNDTTTQDIERSANDLEQSLPTNENTIHHTSGMEKQIENRRQIIQILAMGRKDRISAKTGQSLETRSEAKPSTPLSPLALEALEFPPIKPIEVKIEEEIDPCDHIAFMLVPKSRYEFQPLVAV